MTPGEFIAKIAPFAVSDMHTSGILASLTMAQAALESGWGSHAPGNNLFGIKGSGTTQTTKEYINGQWTLVQADFRAYPDWGGSLRDHSALLAGNKRYRAVVGERDYVKACRAIQAAGYATDPAYADKLISIIRTYGLDKFDREGEKPVKVAETNKTPDWKVKAISDGEMLGLISKGAHKPEETADKAFVVQVAVNLAKLING